MKFYRILYLLILFPFLVEAQSSCNLSNYTSAYGIPATGYPYFSAGTGITVTAATAGGVSTLSNFSYTCNSQTFNTAAPAWWLNNAGQSITLTFSAPVSSITLIFNGTNSCEEFYFASNCGTVSLSNYCTSGYSLINGGTGLLYSGASTSGNIVTVNVPGGATVFTLTHNGCGAGSRIGLLRAVFLLGAFIIGAFISARVAILPASFLEELIDNPDVRYLIAFTVIFVIVFAVISIMGAVVCKIVSFTPLKWLDRWVGSVLGFLAGIILVGLAILYMLKSPVAGSEEWIKGSFLATFIKSVIAPVFQEYMHKESAMSSVVFKRML